MEGYMKALSKKNFMALFAGFVIATFALLPTAVSARTMSKPAKPSIVEIVLKDDGEFDVLQAAVVRAGLVDALNGDNQLTVFAPTDAAFVKTLGVTNEAAAIDVVNSLPVDQLTNILTYHVTNGRLSAFSVLVRPSYKMLNGDRLTRHEVFRAGIAKVNVQASNGIVHVINSVLMP